MTLAQPGRGQCVQRPSGVDRMCRAAEGLMMGARDAWLIRAVKEAKIGAQISLTKGL